jgi:hypothetical protein
MAAAFADVASAVASGSSFDSVRDSLNAIDFLSFTIEDLGKVQSAEWLPSEAKVAILRQWVRAQDSLLEELHGRVLLTGSLPVQETLSLFNILGAPATAGNSGILTNIFERLATAGGMRPFTNPALTGIISVDIVPHPEEPVGESEFGVYRAFDGNEQTFYRSASATSRLIQIGLPPFLKVKLTSYTIGAPVPSLKSWKLEAAADSKGPWELIDAQTVSSELNGKGKKATFQVDGKDYFRYFRLEQVDQNHQGNLSIHWRTIDISGIVVVLT